MTIQKASTFTLRAKGILDELMTSVRLSHGGKIPNNSLVFSAIWDTGATSCSITRDAADKIGALPNGIAHVSGVHGTEKVFTYTIDLYLPNSIVLYDINVCEIAPDAGCDVLIGMNVITLGDFCITNFNNKTTFSFRIPSFEEIDYNSQVPTGYVLAPKRS